MLMLAYYVLFGLVYLNCIMGAARVILFTNRHMSITKEQDLFTFKTDG